VTQCQIIRYQIVCIEKAMRASASIVSLARGGTMRDMVVGVEDHRKAEELNMPPLNCI